MEISAIEFPLYDKDYYQYYKHKKLNDLNIGIKRYEIEECRKNTVEYLEPISRKMKDIRHIVDVVNGHVRPVFHIGNHDIECAFGDYMWSDVLYDSDWMMLRGVIIKEYLPDGSKFKLYVVGVCETGRHALNDEVSWIGLKNGSLSVQCVVGSYDKMKDALDFYENDIKKFVRGSVIVNYLMKIIDYEIRMHLFNEKIVKTYEPNGVFRALGKRFW